MTRGIRKCNRYAAISEGQRAHRKHRNSMQQPELGFPYFSPRN